MDVKWVNVFFSWKQAVVPVELPESFLRDRAALHGLQVQSGRVVVTNAQTGRDRSLADSLAATSLKRRHILKPDDAFPGNGDDPDLSVLLDHVALLAATEPALVSTLWSITADPVWMEFLDLRHDKLRPAAFIEPFPVGTSSYSNSAL